MREIQCWPVHFDDDVPRWRVVTLQDNIIVAERTFHEEELAMEYLITLKGMNGRPNDGR